MREREREPKEKRGEVGRKEEEKKEAGGGIDKASCILLI